MHCGSWPERTSVTSTDRIVQVNPFGAYSVEKAVYVSYKNVSVMPYSDEWERSVVYQGIDKFLVAATRGQYRNRRGSRDSTE